MSISLLNLYHSILIPTLSDWILDEDLCCLDTAVCSSKLRPGLLNLLSQCFVVNVGLSLVTYEKYDWFRLRDVKLRSISLLKHNIELSSSILSLGGKSIHLEARACRNLRDFITESGAQVASLKLHPYFWDFFLEDTLSVLSALTKLDLSMCNHVSEGFCAKIPHLCPNLRHFAAPSGSNALPVFQLCELDSADNVSSHILFPIQDRREYKPPSMCNLIRAIDETVPAIEICGRRYLLKCLDIHQQSSERERCLFERHLEHLETLRINRSISKLWIQYIAAKCCNLTSLSFMESNVRKQAMIDVIQNSPSLRKLRIINCYNMTNQVVWAIANSCPLLESLEITKFTANEFMCGSLHTHCTRLTLLAIEHGSLGYDALRHIAVDLELLWLVRTYYTNQWNRRTFQRLKSVFFISMHYFSSDELKSVFLLNPRLLKIEMEMQNNLTDEVMEALVASCPLLNSVKIIDCSSVTTLFETMAKCDSLTSLSYRSLKSSSATSMVEFLRAKPNLRKLSLPGMKESGPAILRALAECCPSLRHLDVSRCGTIESSDVLALLRNCQSIEYLNLEGCVNVNGQVLAGVPHSMRYLNVRLCNFSKRELRDFQVAYGFRCSYELVY